MPFCVKLLQISDGASLYCWRFHSWAHALLSHLLDLSVNITVCTCMHCTAAMQCLLGWHCCVQGPAVTRHITSRSCTKPFRISDMLEHDVHAIASRMNLQCSNLIFHAKLSSDRLPDCIHFLRSSSQDLLSIQLSGWDRGCHFLSRLC